MVSAVDGSGRQWTVGGRKWQWKAAAGSGRNNGRVTQIQCLCSITYQCGVNSFTWPVCCECKFSIKRVAPPDDMGCPNLSKWKGKFPFRHLCRCRIPFHRGISNFTWPVCCGCKFSFKRISPEGMGCPNLSTRRCNFFCRSIFSSRGMGCPNLSTWRCKYPCKSNFSPHVLGSPNMPIWKCKCPCTSTFYPQDEGRHNLST